MTVSLRKPPERQTPGAIQPKVKMRDSIKQFALRKILHIKLKAQAILSRFGTWLCNGVFWLGPKLLLALWPVIGVAAATLLIEASRESLDAFLKALTAIGTITVALTVWRTTRAYYASTILIADRKLRLDLHEKRVPLYRTLRKIIKEIDVRTWDRSIGIDSQKQYYALHKRASVLADDITIFFADEALSRDVDSISARVHDFVGTRKFDFHDRPEKKYFRELSWHLKDVDARMLEKIQLHDAV